MLSFWLPSIALCIFLKDRANNPFYYAKAIGSDKICIAHLDYDKESDAVVLQNVSETNADIVSLVTSSGIGKQSFVFLRKKYPYLIDISSRREDGQKNYLFSKFRLSIQDTFFHSGNPHVNGYINYDTIKGKKIQFMSFLIDDENAFNHDSLNYLINKIENRQNTGSNIPMMVIGDVMSESWATALRNFKSNMILNDSRLDMNLSYSGKHIYYSSQIRCIKFSENEQGVYGIYELKSDKAEYLKKQNTVISQR